MNAETRRIETTYPVESELQWGRVLMNAETQPADTPADDGEHASMGPRSHERGNLYPERVPFANVAGFNGAAFS